MLLIVMKVLLTSLLVVGSTLAIRKWGDSAGGLLLGLPLVSGPASIFLFAEHGSAFAEKAANGTLLGLAAGACFCVCYARVSERHSWRLSLAGGIAGFLAAAWALSWLALDLRWNIALAVGACTVASGLMPRPRRIAKPKTSADKPSRRSLALRIALASGSVVLLTATAGLLGPVVSGILAPLPVVSAVMASGMHRRIGAAAAESLLRATVLASYGGAAFFAVVGGLLGTGLAPAAAYAIAASAALVAGSAPRGCARLAASAARANRHRFAPLRAEHSRS